jgi:flavin reductase (DIM6/NTAB) family NADH-FMN oxidoreductase RutF
MAKVEEEPFEGILALPSFPLVLVTVGGNIMTAAAFSFYSFEPPCVMVGIRPETFTYELIRGKREFGINILRKDQLEIARICGSASGRTEDKFAKAGVTPQKPKVIDSPLVAECPVSIECRVVHEIEHGGTHRWFIGRIELAHIDEAYTRDDALMYWPTEYRGVGDVLLKVEPR